MTVRSRDTISSHNHHDQVQCTALLAKEVISRIVGCSGLRDLIVWAGLESMNEIGKKDGVVDEENWDVDSNNVLEACVSSPFPGVLDVFAHQSCLRRCRI